MGVLKTTIYPILFGSVLSGLHFDLAFSTVSNYPNPGSSPETANLERKISPDGIGRFLHRFSPGVEKRLIWAFPSPGKRAIWGMQARR